jgi:hypothetical protein
LRRKMKFWNSRRFWVSVSCGSMRPPHESQNMRNGWRKYLK